LFFKMFTKALGYASAAELIVTALAS
jgi:hypothetical protein